MAQQTTNYNLNKIEKTDKVRDSIEHLNQNADLIDTELKKLNDEKASIEYVNNLVGDYETAMTNLIEGAGI